MYGLFKNVNSQLIRHGTERSRSFCFGRPRGRFSRRRTKQRRVSASSLSVAVRRLETRLELRLLNRTTRSVAPTEAGAAVARQTHGHSSAKWKPRWTCSTASAMKPTGTLQTERAVERRAHRITGRHQRPFLKAYPDIRVEVVVEDGFVDVLSIGCDAGIRYDERLGQDMIAVPIGPRVQRFATAAAPCLFRPCMDVPSIHANCFRMRVCVGDLPGGATPTCVFERDGEVLQLNPSGPLMVRPGAAIDLAVSCCDRGRRHHPSVRRHAAAYFESVALESRFSNPGGNRFQDRFSTIPDGGICPRRSAHSSTF